MAEETAEQSAADGAAPAAETNNSGEDGFASPDAPSAFDGANDATTSPATEDEAVTEKVGESNGVPEKYEVSLPEGYSLSDDREAEFVKFAKSNDFTNEQAQNAVDLYVKMEAQSADRVMSEWQTRSSQWVQQSKEAGLMDQAVLAQAKAGLVAVDKAGDLGQTLHHLGLDHHPGIIEAFRSHGKAVSTVDTVPTSAADGPARAQSMAERMYPTMFNSEE